MKSKYRNFLQRTLWISLLGGALILMFSLLRRPEMKHEPQLLHIIFMILYFLLIMNLLFNGLLFLDRKLDRKIPWFYYPRKRLVVEASIAVSGSVVFFTINFYFLKFVAGIPRSDFPSSRALFSYIVIMIVLFVCISIVIARNFFLNWQKSLLEVEQLKREKIKSDYQALQNQLNPHFLFNNFNMLLAEIRRAPDNAIRITETLSDVYRYVLESKNHETVSLKEEIEFAESFLFLQKVRFGVNLTTRMEVTYDMVNYRVPPLTLQILIENAIKHNVVSSGHPLTIEIVCMEDEYLAVSNNIRLKKSTYSTGTGLKNIKMRYSYLTDRKVMAEADSDRFTVKVPLLRD